MFGEPGPAEAGLEHLVLVNLDRLREFAVVLEEYSDAGVVLVSYTYGLDLISQDRAGVMSYYHADGQLSTRFLTDAAGLLTDAYDFDVFGRLLHQTGSTVNTFHAARPRRRA